MPEQLSFDFMVPAQDQSRFTATNLTKGAANMSEHSLLVEMRMINRGKLKAFADVRAVSGGVGSDPPCRSPRKKTFKD